MLLGCRARFRRGFFCLRFCVRDSVIGFGHVIRKWERLGGLARFRFARAVKKLRVLRQVFAETLLKLGLFTDRVEAKRFQVLPQQLDGHAVDADAFVRHGVGAIFPLGAAPRGALSRRGFGL